MLCVEDALDAMAWARSVGGTAGLEKRTRENARALTQWIERTPWLEFLAVDPATRSPTSICMRLASHLAAGVALEEQAAAFARVVKVLEEEGAALDIGAYRDAPPGLRIWCGATVETADLVLLTQWIDWAWAVHGLGHGTREAAAA